MADEQTADKQIIGSKTALVPLQPAPRISLKKSDLRSQLSQIDRADAYFLTLSLGIFLVLRRHLISG
ncbi:hypothetical protein CEY04_23480 [Achromobacter sp. HZ28]|nr:hypothetical protein CEY05_24645 [Achromobacter sp. HZ34]OWT73350.1 hypothetical protein CEY04_23480 [Achromobacter sp. HZ28]